MTWNCRHMPHSSSHYTAIAVVREIMYYACLLFYFHTVYPRMNLPRLSFDKNRKGEYIYSSFPTFQFHSFSPDIWIVIVRHVFHGENLSIFLRFLVFWPKWWIWLKKYKMFHTFHPEYCVNLYSILLSVR